MNHIGVVNLYEIHITLGPRYLNNSDTETTSLYVIAYDNNFFRTFGYRDTVQITSRLGVRTTTVQLGYRDHSIPRFYFRADKALLVVELNYHITIRI